MCISVNCSSCRHAGETPTDTLTTSKRKFKVVFHGCDAFESMTEDAMKEFVLPQESRRP